MGIGSPTECPGSGGRVSHNRKVGQWEQRLQGKEKNAGRGRKAGREGNIKFRSRGEGGFLKGWEYNNKKYTPYNTV